MTAINQVKNADVDVSRETAESRERRNFLSRWPARGVGVSKEMRVQMETDAGGETSKKGERAS